MIGVSDQGVSGNIVGLAAAAHSRRSEAVRLASALGCRHKTRRPGAYLRAEPVAISVVIPVFDEELALPTFLDALKHVMQRAQGDGLGPYEIIVVDDGSRDATRAAALGVAASWPQLRVISLGRNFGHQIALMEGLRRACGRTVITMDGDGQHPAEMIPKALQHFLLSELDVLHLQRREGGRAMTKRATSRAFYRFIDRFLPEGATPQGDFRLISIDVVEALERQPGPIVLRTALPLLGLRSETIEYEEQERAAGSTKYTTRRMVRLAIDAILTVSTRPLRMASVMALMVMAGTFLWALYVLAEWLRGATVQGWASVMLAVLALSGLQLIALAMLGVYVARLYDAVMRRGEPFSRELTAGGQKPSRRTPPAPPRSGG